MLVATYTNVGLHLECFPRIFRQTFLIYSAFNRTYAVFSIYKLFTDENQQRISLLHCDMSSQVSQPLQKLFIHKIESPSLVEISHSRLWLIPSSILFGILKFIVFNFFFCFFFVHISWLLLILACCTVGVIERFQDKLKLVVYWQKC